MNQQPKSPHLPPTPTTPPTTRPKGSRNRLGQAFVQALQDDFQEHGPQVIETIRSEKPDNYLKLVASLLPNELKVTTEIELSDEQLDQRIRQLAAALGLALGGEERAGEAAGGEAAPAR